MLTQTLRRAVATAGLALGLVAGASIGAQATPVWVTVFDQTAALPDGAIDHTMTGSVLTLAIEKMRFYTVGGGGSYVDLDPYLGIGSTLQDHIDQAFIPSGFESDDYKRLSVDTGSNLTSFFITNDNDAAPVPDGYPLSKIRQTDYTGTPDGLVTAGASTSTNFADYGRTSYLASSGSGTGYDQIVYRFEILTDVKSMPVPAAGALLAFGLAGLGLLRRRKAA